MSNNETKTETENDTENGLHGKYEVRKNGEAVTDCFVLEPETDRAARMAIRTYAAMTTNDVLASELRDWIDDIENIEETHE